MINNVLVLVGRMTRDAELRYTPSNQEAIAAFQPVTVNRNFRVKMSAEADFINCGDLASASRRNLANWAERC